MISGVLGRGLCPKPCNGWLDRVPTYTHDWLHNRKEVWPGPCDRRGFKGRIGWLEYLLTHTIGYIGESRCDQNPATDGSHTDGSNGSSWSGREPIR